MEEGSWLTQNSRWILVIGLLAIFLLWGLLRRKGNVRKYPEIVQALLFDIKFNQALAEYFSKNVKYRRFEKANWEIHKERIGFLEDSLRDMLREVFTMVDEFNVKIKEAKKAKDESHKNIDLTEFIELVGICRDELENWMVEKTGSKDLPPKYPTLMGWLFGER